MTHCQCALYSSRSFTFWVNIPPRMYAIASSHQSDVRAISRKSKPMSYSVLHSKAPRELYYPTPSKNPIIRYKLIRPSFVSFRFAACSPSHVRMHHGFNPYFPLSVSGRRCEGVPRRPISGHFTSHHRNWSRRRQLKNRIPHQPLPEVESGDEIANQTNRREKSRRGPRPVYGGRTDKQRTQLAINSPCGPA